VNRRRGIVVVFDLGLGECGAVGGAPVDRALPALDEAAFGECREGLEDRRFEPVFHGEVGPLPFTPHAEALEFFTVDRHPLRGVFTTLAAERDAVGAAGPALELLADLDLDRHAVVVPPRDVGGIEAQQRRGADRGVLPDLVGRGAHVDVVVRIRRSVVEQPHRAPAACFAELLVEAALPPGGEALRLTARKVRLHREVGLRKVEGVAVTGHSGSFRQ